MSELTETRLKLLAQGYNVLPNTCKACYVPGYNTPEFVAREMNARRIAMWPSLWSRAISSGVRLDNGLMAIDGDVEDLALSDALWEIVTRIAPEVAARAPARYGGGENKVAWFCRFAGPDPFRQIKSRQYARPAEIAAWKAAMASTPDGAERPPAPPNHRVEIFGGKTTEAGNSSRQFGVYGPHSLNDDGTVKAMYRWAEGAELADTPLADLPELTTQQAIAIVDAFDAAALALGWEALPEPHSGGGDGDVVYDITAETRFDTNRGGTGITYAELCNAYAVHSDLRCSASFMPLRGDSGNREHCSVSDKNHHKRVGVFVFGDEQMHFPVELKPGPKTSDDEPVILGPDVGSPKALDWRERYVASGYPKASLHNARLAIEALGLVCSRDTFHNVMWLGRSDAASASEPLPPYCGEVNDASLGLLRVCLSDTYGLDFTEKHTRDAVVTLGEENRFDPVCDMLAEAEANWDGKPRLDRMAVDYFNAENTPLNRQMVRKTMIAAVARARQPGIKFDTILTMESPEGYNKSSAWALLAGEGNFSDASILGHNGREVQEQLAGIWIHENPELAGMKKAEAETIKAFASRQVDRARPAYGHFLIAQPRHSIEVGTTNSDSYLQSATGNRRFWPLRVERAIDLRKLRRDRLQLWGEAATLQVAGEAITLDEALWAAAAVEQEARRVQHPWEAQLAKMVVVPTSPEGIPGGVMGCMVLTLDVSGELRVHTRDIFEHVLKLPNVQMNRGHSMALLEAMKILGWQHKPSIRIENRVAAGYVKSSGTGV